MLSAFVLLHFNFERDIPLYTLEFEIARWQDKQSLGVAQTTCKFIHTNEHGARRSNAANVLTNVRAIKHLADCCGICCPRPSTDVIQ